MPQKLVTIGRAERIILRGLIKLPIPAKVDTGADLSSMWATDIRMNGDNLTFKLFGPSSKYYTGEVINLPSADFRITRIANSFGHKELRYVVKLSIELAGRKVRATFSLSDRSQKLYPILLGRRLLKGKYIVDVSLGEPLHDEERQKYRKLQNDLKQINTEA